MRLFATVLAAAFLATPAFADSVKVEFLPAPNQNIFAVQVNGKTTSCTIVSSVTARGPKGCNFVVGIGADGKLERNAQTDSNSGCKLTCQ